jgi:hypothetical protein
MHHRSGWTVWPFDLLSSSGSANVTPLPSSLPPSHSRSIQGLPPARVPANNAASLASRSLLNLGILPKADQGWRVAHGDHIWFTRDYSATLPSHWAQQVLGQNLLVDVASHLDIDLSRALPVSIQSIRRPSLQTAAAAPRVLRPNYALASAFFFPTNLVTTPSTVQRCLSLAPFFIIHPTNNT